MTIPTLSDMDTVFNKIAEVCDLVSKTGAVCITLAPLPKFQIACCQDPKHGLDNGSPALLSTRIREINTFMERSTMFNSVSRKMATVSAFDVFGDQVNNPANKPCLHSKDNVHPDRAQLSRVASTLLLVREHLLTGGTLHQQCYSLNNISFSQWQPLYAAAVGSCTSDLPSPPVNKPARSCD